MTMALLEDMWNTPVKNGQQCFISMEAFEKYSWSHSIEYRHLRKANVLKNDRNANIKQNSIKQEKSPKKEIDEKFGNLAKTATTSTVPPPSFKRKWAFPQTDVPYPKLSSLKKEEHYEYVEKYIWFTKMKNSNKPIPNFDSKFEALHKRVIKEQEEFQAFAKKAANESLHKYNYIHPDADVYIKHRLRNSFKRVYHYPRYYSHLDTIPLIILSKEEVKLHYIKSLLEMGKMAAILLPTLKVKTNVPMAYAKISQRYPVSDNRNISEQKMLYKKAVSEDPNAETLAKKYKANVVISSGGMKKLMGNILNNVDSSWEIPIVIRKYESSDNDSGPPLKVVYIDKPFPKKESTYYERSIWYHKFALKTFVCHPRHMKVRHLDVRSSKESNQLSSNSAQDVDDDIFQSQDDLYALETFGTESSIKKSNPKTATGASHSEITNKKENISKTVTSIVCKQEKEDSQTAVSSSNLANDSVENGSVSTSNTCIKMLDSHSKSEILKANDEKQSDSNCAETCLPNIVDVKVEQESEISASKQISTEDSDSDSERLVIDVDIHSPPAKKLRTCTKENKNKVNPTPEILPVKKEIKIEEDDIENCRYSLRSRSRRQRRDSNEKSSDDGHTNKLHDLDKRSKPPIKKVIKEEPSTDENSNSAFETPGKGGLNGKSTQRRSSLTCLNESSKQASSKCKLPNKPPIKSTMQEIFGVNISDDENELHEPVSIEANTSKSSNVSCKHRNREIKPAAHSEQGTSNKRTTSKSTSKTRKSSTLDEILDMQEKLLGSKIEHNKNVASEASGSETKCLNIETAELLGLDPVLLLENENTENYLPPSSDSNITYSLWCLNKLRLIIRNSIDGNIAVDHPFKMNQHCCLYPKLEYQSLYGGETMSPNENIKLWITTLIRRNSKAVRVRIDALTSEILSVEHLDLNQITSTNGFSSFNPENAVRLLHHILMKLTSLNAGNYVLIRNKEDGYLKLLVQTDTPKGGAYDLHSSYNFVLNENPVPCKTAPWNPIDPSIYFRHHTLKHKIPATFEMKVNKPRGRPPGSKSFNNKNKKKKNVNKKNQKSKQC